MDCCYYPDSGIGDYVHRHQQRNRKEESAYILNDKTLLKIMSRHHYYLRTSLRASDSRAVARKSPVFRRSSSLPWPVQSQLHHLLDLDAPHKPYLLE